MKSRQAGDAQVHWGEDPVTGMCSSQSELWELEKARSGHTGLILNFVLRAIRGVDCLFFF